MKAYVAEYPGNGWEFDVGTDLTFGTNLDDAKANFFKRNSVFKVWPQFCDCRVADVKFYRFKAFDNLETLSAMKIAEKLITEAHWLYEVNDQLIDEDNFDKQKFERDWIEEYGSEQVCVV